MGKTINDLDWGAIIAVAMYKKDKTKTYTNQEIYNLKELLEYKKYKDGVKDPDSSIRFYLQVHTLAGNKFVENSGKKEQALFDCTGRKQWKLCDDGIMYVENNLKYFLNEDNNIASELDLLTKLIKEYQIFKTTEEYDEQYKWDYAIKNQNIFQKLSDLEDKIAQIGSPNFQTYFIRNSGIKWLLNNSPEILEESFRYLFEETVDLKNRIIKFRATIKNALVEDEGWKNKKLTEPGVDTASFFLFTNDYKKHMLFSAFTPFNNYAKKLGISELFKKDTNEERYISWQDYCFNILIPKMNEVLNNENTLLDAQDMIWFVGNQKELWSPDLNALMEDLLKYGESYENIYRYPTNNYIGLKLGNAPGKAIKPVCLIIRNNELRVDFDKSAVQYLPDEYKKMEFKEFDAFPATLQFSFSVITDENIQIAKAMIDAGIKSFNNGILPRIKQLNYIKTQEENQVMTNQPLNQILYGPPGTGKTYNTAIEALKIIEPDFEPKDRDELIIKYNFYKDNGQIQFITFHQSYSYEEFIEGIRPVLNSDNVKYTLNAGIFKHICNDAQRGPFSEVFEKFKNQYKAGSELETAYYHNPFFIEEYRSGTIKIKGQNGLIHYKDLEQVYNEDTNCSFKSRKEIEDKYINIKDTNVLSEIYSILLMLRTIKVQIDKKYVLIIDEINRGNISKIFGELITLIEENKRTGEGQVEALEVTLPYSKEKFGVPKNLYLIGTMNTSDRSIASVDIALRRRFRFKEMMPKYSLIPETYQGVNLRSVVKNINDKISVLLDRDHQIGHSYFMDEKLDRDELENIWFGEVMPLFNEYFFGEWDKLIAVLGLSTTKNPDGGFVKQLDCPKGLGTEWLDENCYDFVRQGEDGFNFLDSLKNLEPTVKEGTSGDE